MSTDVAPILYTIGHSTRPIGEFIAMLRAQEVDMVVDIRRFPGSRKYPWFGQEALRASLADAGVMYLGLSALGGRRKALPNTHNTRWRNVSFRGYADYMETPAFYEGIEALEELARHHTVAIMCAEAVWWRCHRSMVSDELKARGWRVMHILDAHKVQEHPYTSPARVVGQHVFYTDPEPDVTGTS